MESGTGTVKFFNETKGYGFIEHADHDDAFFHFSDCIGDLSKFVEGACVQFKVTTTERGEKALDVTVEGPE